MTNTINQYPNSYELSDVIKDYVRQTDLLAFLRSKGIFYFNASHEKSSELTSHILFDAEEINRIRKIAYRENHNYILSGVTFVSDSTFNLEDLYNNIREEEKYLKFGYNLKSLLRIADNQYEGCIEYTRKRIGKTTFLKYELHEISFKIIKLSDFEWRLEIDGDSSNDCIEIQKLFSKIVKDQNIKYKELNITSLTVDQTILFFDRLAKEGLDGQWEIKDILRLTLKNNRNDNKESNEIESSENEDEQNDKEATKEQLTGISQAILEGKNLRENTFVHHAEKSGYLFSSMTYQFEHKENNCQLKIRAEFKGNPKLFEVSLESCSIPSDDNDLSNINSITITEEQNYKIRSQFWNSALSIYMDLIMK